MTRAASQGNDATLMVESAATGIRDSSNSGGGKISKTTIMVRTGNKDYNADRVLCHCQ
jgi:hypothetical protein